MGSDVGNLPGNSAGELSGLSGSSQSQSEGGSDGASVGVLDLSESPQVVRGQVNTLLEQGDISAATIFIDILYSQELMRYTLQRIPIRLYTFEDIRQLLAGINDQTDAKAAVVYTMVQDTRMHVILVPPNGAPVHKVVENVTAEAISEKTNTLRANITSPIERRSNSYLNCAQQLYDWIVRPIEADIAKNEIDTVLFSMDAPLRSLPIAALHDGDRFLVEKLNLAQIPSLNLTDARLGSFRDAPVLAMGSSEFTELQPLPAVPVELEVVVGNDEVKDVDIGGEPLWEGTSFLNEEFTFENLRSQREENRSIILHLATHANFLPGTPNNSYIQFWDSQLGINDMENLNWRVEPTVELLVLSACRTAIGNDEVRLGFAGLAVQAGVKTAVASLWYVSDEGTLALMTEFYHHLKTANIKADALREAQIAMLRGEVTIVDGEIIFDNLDRRIKLPPELAYITGVNLQHPYYWAAFNIIGSPW
jgi:CHAT domain-containing protein